jgi:trk system potassium uptake protein TrkA
MYVIIVGCGRVGAELADGLSQRGHDVTVVDFVGASFRHLPHRYRGRTIEAESLSEGVLKRAGIEKADAVAAVTNSDAVNAVVARVASEIFHVPRVVTRNYDPRWRSLHEALGIQTVSTTAWGAQRIEELLENPQLRPVFSAGNGEIEVYELVVPAALAGRELAALTGGIECVVVSLARAGRARLPRSGDLVEAGDVVHIGATLEQADALRQRFASGEGR